MSTTLKECWKMDSNKPFQNPQEIVGVLDSLDYHIGRNTRLINNIINLMKRKNNTGNKKNMHHLKAIADDLIEDNNNAIMLAQTMLFDTIKLSQSSQKSSK